MTDERNAGPLAGEGAGGGAAGVATARPWTFLEFPHGKFGKWRIYGADDERLAVVRNRRGYDEELANAGLIVRAVNSYDSTLAALKKCVACLECSTEHRIGNPAFEQAASEARAALSRAGGV